MAEEKSVIVLFVDMRGFTNWSEAVEVFANLDIFILGFLSIVRRSFDEREYSLRPLGDGAMLVQEFTDEPTPAETRRSLNRVLKLVRRVNKEFAEHCASFSDKVGHRTDLLLGWGIVRGKVHRVGEDWAGGNINKCARLCAEARPFGTIIDRDDFPAIPTEFESGFVPEIRRLAGIHDDTPVWVTREIASQFVPRERIRQDPEVHVAGTCVRRVNGKIELLVARRSVTRSLYPGKLEGCGGQLRRSESFSDGVKRHFSLELGLDVEVIEDLHRFYEIREPDTPLIPGIRFLCLPINGQEPRSVNHSEVYWVPESGFRAIPGADFVGNLKAEVLELLEAYRSRLASGDG